MASRPHNSPCAPALGDMATAGMPVSVVSQFINSRDQRQRALGGGARRQGMQVAEAGQPRHFLVQARIVLHGAGAQRIKPRIDGVILPRQPHIMADHFRLAEARQADGALAAQAAQPRLGHLHIGQIHAGDAVTPDSKISFSSWSRPRSPEMVGKLIVLRACRGLRRAALIVHAHAQHLLQRRFEGGEIFIGVGFGGGDDQKIRAPLSHAASAARPARRPARPSPPAHPPQARRAWAASR